MASKSGSGSGGGSSTGTVETTSQNRDIRNFLERFSKEREEFKQATIEREYSRPFWGSGYSSITITPNAEGGYSVTEYTAPNSRDPSAYPGNERSLPADSLENYVKSLMRDDRSDRATTTKYTLTVER